ncbi:MAG TPA: DUF948 domain-containing protein [Candidatus Sulfotelmatobacter sp.]|nr:DUF948 domain-containing protein [Candidatus Sulfotelmatobacter sp.]
MWEIAVGVLAAIGVVLAAFAIPILMHLRRSLDRVDRLLHEAEVHLGPALAEFREMTRNLNKASAGVADGVAQVGRTFEAVGELGKTLQGANAVLRAALGPGVTLLGGLIAGVKAGGRVLLRQLFRRR